MTVDSQSTPGPQFKDRSTGLIVFGVIQILMGFACAMFIPLILLSLMVGPPAGAATNVRMMIPALGVYAVLAVLLVSLGIGSIRARRWARALTLVLAWMWLAMGVTALLIVSIWMPDMSEMAPPGQQIPPQAMIFIQVVMFGTMGCMYIALPGIFVSFYQSRHVKATCEFKDPQVRWTDRCPLPVLALSLMLGFGAVSMVPSSISYGVMPFFGILLKGLPAALVILGTTLLFAYLAWATYKLKMAAWWTTLIVYGVFGVSGLVTFSRIGMMEFYREMDMPEDQLELIQRSGMLDGMNIPLMMGVGFAAAVGYMLWVRRYFVAASAAQADS